ncbi:MAG: HEPN domain-containing protein [Nanoarchaeota archaeon]
MKTFDDCVNRGGLKNTEIDFRIISKELAAAKNDLQSSKRSISDDDFSWAIVQAYYSCFHAARALLILKGWREPSHECVPVALKKLLLDELPTEKADVLNDLRYLRMKVNYELEDFQESTAKDAVESSSEFIQAAEEIVKTASEKTKKF